MTETLERTLDRPPRGDGVPLICLPYAGGGSRSYESWQNLLPPKADPLTVRLAGRESRLDEPLPEDLTVEAARCAAGLAPVLTGRFAVFGHSMGALLAYELAVALRERIRREPACLIVSGSAAPSRREHLKRYEHLDDAELRAEIEAMGGTNRELLDDAQAWALIRPVLRADLLMCDRYRMASAEPLSCPIVVYGARDDHDLPTEYLEMWREHTTGGFEKRIFPGNHFYFQRIPEAFAMDLNKRLYRHVLDSE